MVQSTGYRLVSGNYNKAHTRDTLDDNQPPQVSRTKNTSTVSRPITSTTVQQIGSSKYKLSVW